MKFFRKNRCGALFNQAKEYAWSRWAEFDNCIDIDIYRGLQGYIIQFLDGDGNVIEQEVFS